MTLHEESCPPEVGYVGRFRRFSRNARLYLFFLFGYSCTFGIFLVGLGLYILRLGYDESLVGSVEMAAVLVGAALCLPGGRLIDRFGAKQVLIGSAALVALGRIGQVVSGDSQLIIAAAMLFGAGMAVHWIASDVLLSEFSTPIERPLLFSSRFATFNAALVVGSILGGLLPALFGVLLGVDGVSAEAYRATLTVAAGISVLSIVPLLLLSPCSTVRLSSREIGLLGYRMRRPGLIAKMVIPHALAAGSMAAIFPFLSIFFRYRLEATTAQAGGVVAMAAAAATVVALLAPKLVDRVGKVRAAACLQVAALPFLLVTGYVPVLGVAMVSVWLARAFAASSYPIMGTFVMETVDKEERGRASAVEFLFWNGGWALSAWVAGMVMAAGNYSLPYLASAVLLVLAAASWYGFLRGREEMPGSSRD